MIKDHCAFVDHHTDGESSFIGTDRIVKKKGRVREKGRGKD